MSYRKLLAAGGYELPEATSYKLTLTLTLRATACRSSLALSMLAAASLASRRAATELLAVPLHPAPPHTRSPSASRQPAPPQGLSGQWPSASPRR